MAGYFFFLTTPRDEVDLVRVTVVLDLVGVMDRDLMADVEPDLLTELFVLTVGLR